MTSTTVSLLISGAGFLASVIASSFISGMHWGELRGDVKEMNSRLAKIEGMFTLTLKDGSSG